MSTYACIIIDDVLLRENYGFLNHQKLLDLMDKHKFHTTIAFIPWNYKRTDKKIADLFKKRPDRFSLCVHGCDHVKNEFGKTDFNYLDYKIKLATARMIEHENRSGIPFDRIMVFPQGVFSNEALEVLKHNNYLAVINTESLPVEGQISSDFPFYKRYRPEALPDDVTDIIFITLHHDFFKNGYKNLTDLVDKINSRFESVTWDSTGNIIRSFVTTHETEGNFENIDLRGFEYYGYKEYFKIFLRRTASELKNDYLCKNNLLYFGRWAKKLFKL